MPSREISLIYLTGFMGSGKSTIAPILASSLGFDLIDIDAQVEQRTGKSVSEIFAVDGEAYFRKIESDLLGEAARRRHCVVALGGGTIANPVNLALVKSTGVLIYLDVAFEILFERLRSRTDRPMLRISSPGDLKTGMASLLSERMPWYREADITVTPGLNAGVSAGDIASRLSALRARDLTLPS